MRRTKALLPWYPQPSSQGLPLFAHLAGTLRSECEIVYLLGMPHAEFEGYQVLPDRIAGLGPLGGIATALEVPGEAWRLILSCDVPLVDSGMIQELAGRVPAAGCDEPDIVAPESSDGRLQPLCALWNARVRDGLLDHLEAIGSEPGTRRNLLSVERFLLTRRVARFRPAHPECLRNLNTMRDYLAALGGCASPETPR